MRRRDQRPDWANLYFEWSVFWIVARIIGAVGGSLLALGYFILASMFPAEASQIAVAIFCTIVLLFILLVIAQIYLWCSKPGPRAEWVPSGAIANPPGEDWFDKNGNKLWVRVGDKWERITPEP
jgi:hypothetical protein